MGQIIIADHIYIDEVFRMGFFFQVRVDTPEKWAKMISKETIDGDLVRGVVHPNILAEWHGRI